MNGAHVAVRADRNPGASAGWGVRRRRAASGLVSATWALNSMTRCYHQPPPIAAPDVGEGSEVAGVEAGEDLPCPLPDRRQVGEVVGRAHLPCDPGVVH